MYPLVSSFLELIPCIFQIKGVTCFLSEKLSQDPLENFFGCQRQCGKTNSVSEFYKNTQSLWVISSLDLHQVTGNCHGLKRKGHELQPIDLNKPLKKRKKLRHYST